MTPHLDMPTLQERRTTAVATLATLEREQGIALLDGQDFDHSAIAATRALICALDAAEVESKRRHEAEAEMQRAAVREKAAQEARAALTAYSAAVARCEVSTKALVADLKAMRDSAATLRGTTLVLGGRLPVPLEEGAIDTVMSRLLVGELQAVAHPSGYGVIKWVSAARDPDWTETIVKHITPAIEASIAKGCP